LVSFKCTRTLYHKHHESFEAGEGNGVTGAVDLEKAANVIVDHSLQDCVFSKEAGRMCYAIIQVGGW
jgi:hypothetical protein